MDISLERNCPAKDREGLINAPKNEEGLRVLVNQVTDARYLTDVQCKGAALMYLRQFVGYSSSSLLTSNYIGEVDGKWGVFTADERREFLDYFRKVDISSSSVAVILFALLRRHEIDERLYYGNIFQPSLAPRDEPINDSSLFWFLYDWSFGNTSAAKDISEKISRIEDINTVYSYLGEIDYAHFVKPLVDYDQFMSQYVNDTRAITVGPLGQESTLGHHVREMLDLSNNFLRNFRNK